jgi:DEAD/DEAH box helicase domain-containing protein
LEKALDYVWHCPCEGGCPSCTGIPGSDESMKIKAWVLKLLSFVSEEEEE